MSNAGSRTPRGVQQGRAPAPPGDDHFGDMLAEAWGLTLPSRDTSEPPADKPEVQGKPERKAARARKRQPAR